LERVVPVPNPQYGPLLRLHFKLKGRADSVEVKLYTAAMVRAGGARAEGPFRRGWSSCALAWPAELPTGLYYAVVTARSNAGQDESGPVKLMRMP
jgi:hypothetical protein